MNSSRRNFLAAGLALPAAATAARQAAVPTAATPHPADDGLRYRTLGKTGLKVTSMGFGCMITSDASVVERAADMGITYFDTARSYQGGNNERMVGAALKSRRRNLVLSTKSDSGSMADLDTSLRELGTDHVDIWYQHGVTSPGQISDRFLETAAAAKKAGKIRFAGVSTHGGQAEVLGAVTANPQLDAVLVAYNFTMGDSLNAAIEAASRAGKSVVAMKVMAGGFRRVRASDPLYGKLKREGALVAALKWVLRSPHIHSTVPSITDMDQLDDNFKSMASPFTAQDNALLAAHLDYIGPMYCRMCGGCEGACPKGLPVADIMRMVTYADGYGQFGLARERFRALPAEVAGVRCADCPACAVECRNGLNVAQRLTRAQELLA